MPTASFTATLFARRASASSNYLDDRAAQGAYAGNEKLVGIINFRTMNMKNKVITGITFRTTCTSKAGAGNGSKKTLYFKKSTRADPTNSTGGTGSSYVGDALGSLSGTNFYDASNTTRKVDEGTSLFTNLKAYFEAGNHTLVIYAPDSVPSSSYSTNYLYINKMVVDITYVEGLVYYGNGEAWGKSMAFWPVDGAWKQCVPYFCVDGVWKQCGG